MKISAAISSANENENGVLMKAAYLMKMSAISIMYINNNGQP
jgi:hypothetical protein